MSSLQGATYMLKKVLKPYQPANSTPNISGFSFFNSAGAGAASIRKVPFKRCLSASLSALRDCRDQYLVTLQLQLHCMLYGDIHTVARSATMYC